MNSTIEYTMREQALPVEHRDKKVRLHLEVSGREEVTVVHCNGRITYRNEANLLSMTVIDLLSRSQYLVLDLSGVEKIDSAGLGELVVLCMQAQANRCVFNLAAPRRQIQDLLRLTNLTSVIQVFPTTHEAIAALLSQGIQLRL